MIQNQKMAKNIMHVGQLSSCAISEKTNNRNLKKFSDGRTDRRTDRRPRMISQDPVRLTSSDQYKLKPLFNIGL